MVPDGGYKSKQGPGLLLLHHGLPNPEPELDERVLGLKSGSEAIHETSSDDTLGVLRKG